MNFRFSYLEDYAVKAERWHSGLRKRRGKFRLVSKTVERVPVTRMACCRSGSGTNCLSTEQMRTGTEFVIGLANRWDLASSSSDCVLAKRPDLGAASWACVLSKSPDLRAVSWACVLAKSPDLGAASSTCVLAKSPDLGAASWACVLAKRPDLGAAGSACMLA
jgi:hypothetical protein